MLSLDTWDWRMVGGIAGDCAVAIRGADARGVCEPSVGWQGLQFEQVYRLAESSRCRRRESRGLFASLSKASIFFTKWKEPVGIVLCRPALRSFGDPFGSPIPQRPQ